MKCFFLCDLVFISNETPLLLFQTVIFSISYTRQEHSETQMLRKRVKDLETEYKQLQLEYQVKESRVVDLENDVEVSFPLFGNELVRLSFSLKWSSTWLSSVFTL